MTQGGRKKIGAVILAAGRGLRMGGDTNSLPKCLLSVGGETILQFQLRALRWAGVDDVAIVTGYRAEAVHEEAKGRVAHFFHNADFDSTNSLYSFYCARSFAEGETLVINSDVVFHPALLTKLIEAPAPNALLYDPKTNMGDEEMKVAVAADGTVAHISKRMPPEQAAGENLGIVRFGAGTAGVAFEILSQGEPDRLRKQWLPECINQLRGVRAFHAIPIGGLPWTEVDFTEDLEFARRSIYAQCAAALHI